jgi:hypothetical protein
MRYREAVREAKRLVKRTEQDHWRLAEITYEQVRDKGVTLRQWASDIGTSHVHVHFLVKVWDDWGGKPLTERPAWADAYAHAQGRPSDPDERSQARRKANADVLLNLPPVERAEMVIRLMTDEEVARELENFPFADRIGTVEHHSVDGEPVPSPAEARRVEREENEKVDRSVAMAQLLQQLATADRAVTEAAKVLANIELTEHESDEAIRYVRKIMSRLEIFAPLLGTTVIDELIRE